MKTSKIWLHYIVAIVVVIIAAGLRALAFAGAGLARSVDNVLSGGDAVRPLWRDFTRRADQGAVRAGYQLLVAEM